MHPATEKLLKFFDYDHLPAPLGAISMPFNLVAHKMSETLPENAETTMCLRKLLEAKDCAVRAALDPRE